MIGKICGVIADSSIDNVLNIITDSEESDIDVLEVRIDYFADPFAIIDKLKDAIEESSIPIILTARTKAENGHMELERGQIQLLIEKLIEASPSYLDLELSFSEPMLLDLLHSAHKAVVKVIGSIYLPKEKSTQDEYIKAITRAKELGVDIVKIVANPNSTKDYLNLMKLLIDNALEEKPIIAYCTGPYGRLSRITAYYSGCEFVYCPITQEKTFGKFNIDEFLEITSKISFSPE